DSDRGKYLDNLIGGLSMFLSGPVAVKLVFHAFVVLVGTLILAGAVNTAIIGSNGVLNRVAEDGVLPDWFRQPHGKYGTTHRLINMVVILQIAAIIITRGNMVMLGEAYAFGVVWSFAMKALSVLVLRYKRPDDREWKVPFNIRIGKTELPVGLGLITIFLFSLACINVLTKKVATISGVSFTIVFFVLFEVSEKRNQRKAIREQHEMEKFRLVSNDDVSDGAVHVRPGNILVAARNPNHLEHLQATLAKTDTRKVDIVVLSVHNVTQAASGEFGLNADQIFANAETELFTKVVTVAEKAGKHVELLAVAGTSPWIAMVQTAQKLQSARIVTGLSPKYTPAQQGKIVGEAWEQLPPPRPSLSLEVVLPDPNQSEYFNLGPHPPRLWPEDVDLLHRLWLDLSEQGPGFKLRHRDVVGVALRRMERELKSDQLQDVMKDVSREVEEHPEAPVVVPPKKGVRTV
ncbi:MAG: APC family permease, partial [Acidobacteriota bacterium]|nr:APC family permease [Acidobacteriota bacterium]